jgi:phage terminase small subunit
MTELPDPPEGLGEAGRQAWQSVGSALARVGVLQEHYLSLLAAFSRAIDMAEGARKELEGKPLVRQGRGGGVHPAFRVWKDAVGVAVRLAEHLGASPVGMARLGLSHVRGLTLAQELNMQRDKKRAEKTLSRLEDDEA